MTARLLITALALSFPLATGACAVADGAYAYRTSPPPSNAKDVFRTVTRAPLSADTHATDAVAVERPR